MLAQGGITPEACRRIGVTGQTYYRWRKEYGGLKVDQPRRMRELEQENGPAPAERFIESFNAGLRDECLNETIFTSLAQGRSVLAA